MDYWKAGTIVPKGFFTQPTAAIRLPHDFNGHFTQPMLDVYATVASDPLPPTLQAPAGLVPLLELVYAGKPFACDTRPYVSRILEVAQSPAPQASAVPIDTKKIIIGYSGGKDSLACLLLALSYKLKPILFHVVGLNRSYPGELEAVEEIAARVGVPVVYPTVHLLGRHDYPDNPVKDQLILAMMVDYGLRIGCQRFTQGVESTNTLKKSNINYNWSDAKEMFDAFNTHYLQPQWPGYRWEWMVETHSHSYHIIHSLDPSLLELTNSCVTPHRFQLMRRQQCMDKYGLHLRENTCGTCWKCCVDYLNMLAIGYEVAWSTLMVERCLRIFKNKINEAYGSGYMEHGSYADLVPVAVDPKYGAGKVYDKILEVARGMEA